MLACVGGSRSFNGASRRSWTVRKAEGACSAPTTTGGIDKRTLFVLAGDSEVVEELAPAARQKEKRRRPGSPDKRWKARIESIFSAFDRGTEATSRGWAPELDKKKSGGARFSPDKRWKARIESIFSAFDRGTEATSRRLAPCKVLY